MRHYTDVLEDVAVWRGGDQTKQNVGTDGKLQACTPFPGAPEAGRAPGGRLLRCTHPWNRDSLGQQVSGAHWPEQQGPSDHGPSSRELRAPVNNIFNLTLVFALLSRYLGFRQASSPRYWHSAPSLTQSGVWPTRSWRSLESVLHAWSLPFFSLLRENTDGSVIFLSFKIKSSIVVSSVKPLAHTPPSGGHKGPWEGSLTVTPHLRVWFWVTTRPNQIQGFPLIPDPPKASSAAFNTPRFMSLSAAISVLCSRPTAQASYSVWWTLCFFFFFFFETQA